MMGALTWVQQAAARPNRNNHHSLGARALPGRFPERQCTDQYENPRQEDGEQLRMAPARTEPRGDDDASRRRALGTNRHGVCKAGYFTGAQASAGLHDAALFYFIDAKVAAALQRDADARLSSRQLARLPSAKMLSKRMRRPQFPLDRYK
jgi:hypothetical protein